MAEGIVVGLAGTIITQLSSAALQEVGSALGVNKEVRRLRGTLTAIKEVLPHAENLQLSNNDVKSWLRRIKDAAYDAEDVIDDFAIEALRKKLMTRGSSIERVFFRLLIWCSSPCFFLKIVLEVVLNVYMYDSWWKFTAIVLASVLTWTYLTTTSLSACLLFHLVCNLQVIHFDDYGLKEHVSKALSV